MIMISSPEQLQNLMHQ